MIIDLVCNLVWMTENYFPLADGSVDKVHVMSVGIYGESQSTFEYGEGESAETLWPPS